MTPHKHADLLHAIADGRKVEMRHSKDCPWYSPSYILRLLDDDAAGDGPTNYEFRVQPETRALAGHMFPEPVREPLANGTRYWLVYTEKKSFLTDDFEWSGTAIDMFWLKRGLIHLTKEGAIAQAKAMIASVGGEP